MIKILMNDAVWLEAQNGILINLNKIAFIKHRSHPTYTEVLVCFSEDIQPIVIAVLTSQKAAEKFLKLMSKMIKSNVKCIDAGLIIEQAENERE